ncbi:hypothetical protein MNB_SV-15-1360 [hydrothermal vent metagenome]|uniref:Prepilin-type N-terminal cleavage/methylation domain-containing protein n=1 Tax=hydrothermal vent metagenome TaxID=652676 RepID=A0A1W1EI65_9ZZZZ
MIKNRNGFVTIEILVAMVIGFLAIIMLTTSIKTVQKVGIQQELYQDLYISVLSIKNIIRAKGCIDNPTLSGEINGFKYSIKCREVKAQKNYIDMLNPITFKDEGGNKGIFMIYLFRVDINIQKFGLDKSYSFYQSEEKRLISEEDLLKIRLGIF